MADNTGIEWTDATWNPVTGCTEVSPGCDHCYAKTFAERWRGTPGHYFERGFDVQLRPDKLDLPLRWKRPRRIFVNSMSDLFHDEVPDEYIAKVFAVMATTRRHTYQVLTKRHGRMRSLLNDPTFFASAVLAEVQRGWSPEAAAQVLIQRGWPLPNVWLGVSAENQQWADIRIPALLDTPAAIRFVSAEPLLGPIDLRQSFAKFTPPIDHPAWDTADMEKVPGGVTHTMRVRDVLHWMIVGGESGHGARPMHPSWARSLRDQCEEARVQYLFKQWGEWTPHAPSGVWDTDTWVCERNGVCVDEEMALADGGDFAGMWRVGKKNAGRELDGQTWDQYPQQSASVEVSA